MHEELWAHQAQEVERYALAPHRFLFWDPRTGKTRPIVLEIGLWIALAGVQHILVVSNIDGCKVWLKEDELGRFDPARVRVLALSDRSIATRTQQLGILGSSLPTVVVVNRDVIFRERVIKGDTNKNRPERKYKGLLLALQRWGVEAIVLDECHDYRRISTARSSAAESLARCARFTRGLSGTPDPKDYIDFYAQYKIVAPEVFGTRKADFIARYCSMNPHYPNKVDSYRFVEELREKIFSVATRVKQEDCFDMPNVLPDASIDVGLTRLARELYTEISKNYVAEFLGLEIDATHQLSRLGILHQLAQGYLRDGDSIEWVHDGKIKAAHRFIEEMLRADKRLVVYYHYTPEGERLIADCVKRYGAAAVGSLHGRTPRSQRSAHPFTDRRGMRLFIAQEETAQLAISLREADHVLWYSWGPKADVHYQARQRIFDERANKPHGLSYTYLRVPNSADGFMTRVISRKTTASDLLLNVGFWRAAIGDV